MVHEVTESPQAVGNDKPVQAAPVESPAAQGDPMVIDQKEEPTEKAKVVEATDNKPKEPHAMDVDTPSSSKEEKKTVIEEEDDVFSPFKPSNARKRTKQRRSKSKKKKIQISIKTSVPDSNKANPTHERDSNNLSTAFPAERWWIEENEEDIGRHEEWLDYYTETHDDQDPAFIAREQKRRQDALDRRLKTVDDKDMNIRKEIDKAVADLMKEKEAQMERGIASYKERYRHDQAKMLQRLDQRYHEKVKATNEKITERMQMLQVSQQKEMKQLLEQHREQVQARRIPNAVASNQWQNASRALQAKHQQQHQKLTIHTDDYKRRTDIEYKSEQDKIRRIQEQKLSDLEAKRGTVVSEMVKQYGVSRQRYMKRHLQRMTKEKDEVKQKFDREYGEIEGINNTPRLGGDSVVKPPSSPTNRNDSSSGQQEHITTTPRELAKSVVEHRRELRPPSPYRSVPEWYLEQHMGEHHASTTSSSSDNKASTALAQDGSSSGDHFKPPETTVGATTRYKHRKGILASTVAQSHPHLTVEIHNEGLWIDRQPGSKSTSSANSPTGNADASSAEKGNNSNNDGNKADGSSNKDKPKSEPEFLEWGQRAYEFLESIINGEIPLGALKYGRRLGFPDDSFMAQTSGQVFCSISDLRTSEETAQVQRSESLKEQELASLLDLENSAGEYTKVAKDHQQALAKEESDEKSYSARFESAGKDLEKAKKHKEEYLRRYRQYLGQDGRPLPTVTEKERRDLENRLMRIDTNLSAALEKEKAARDRHTISKARLQKLQASAKHSHRSALLAAAVVKKRKAMYAAANKKTTKSKSSETGSERPFPKVKDVMGMLSRVAHKRREQHDQKKTGQAVSTWLQKQKDLPDAFKKSVWRRMHRRRIQIVLRPTTDFLCNEIRGRAATAASAESINVESNDSKQRTAQEIIEEKTLHAEQLFLLACHPEADPSALSVPTSKSTEAWAEPGWQLDLSVPKKEENGWNVLPRARTFPVLDRNQTEMCSVSGRQAASLLSTSHLKALRSRMSTFGIISSPAEILSVLDTRPDPSETELDPFTPSQARLKAAYTYTPKAVAPTKATAQARRKSTKEETEAATASSKATAGKDRATSAATERPEKKRRTSKSEPSPRKRTKKQEAAVTAAAVAAASKNSDTTTSVTPKTAAAAPAPASKATATPASSRAKAPAASPQQQQKQQQQQKVQQKQQPPSARPKPPQIQTQQMPPHNAQNSYPSPHQRQQQQMAQLRMMQQARPGQVPGFQPPPPGSMQQMQQFYAPLNHPNGPSPRTAGQYHPTLSPNMARMQPGGGPRQVSMPMHQGMPMPGPAGQHHMAGRPMPAPVGSPPPMGAMPPVSAAQQQAQRNRAAGNSSQQQQQQQQQQSKQQQQQDSSQKDQNDPLFMLK